jgi:hypothetical protein
MGDCRLCSLVPFCHDHGAQILEFPDWLVHARLLARTAGVRKTVEPRFSAGCSLAAAEDKFPPSFRFAARNDSQKIPYKPKRD